MTTIKRIGLEDIQDLTESFANFKVVNLKMNTTGCEHSMGNMLSPPEQSRKNWDHMVQIGNEPYRFPSQGKITPSENEVKKK